MLTSCHHLRGCQCCLNTGPVCLYAIGCGVDVVECFIVRCLTQTYHGELNYLPIYSGLLACALNSLRYGCARSFAIVVERSCLDTLHYSQAPQDISSGS